MSSKKSPLDYAYEAEQDLNSYQAKTGAGNNDSSDDTGINASAVESKFPGSIVKAGEDFISSGSYNRKIPQDEGGDVDDRGRVTRGSQFEGQGGPEDDAAQQAANYGGNNDQDVQQVPGYGDDDQSNSYQSNNSRSYGSGSNNSQSYNSGSNNSQSYNSGSNSSQSYNSQSDNYQSDNYQSNNKPSSRGNNFKGNDYYDQESVPDSTSAQGNIAPDSVTQSGEEGYDD